jgi:hypothetical protein
VCETNAISRKSRENLYAARAISNKLKNTIPPLYNQEKPASEMTATTKFLRQEK